MKTWQWGEVVLRSEQLGLQPDDVETPQPVEGVWLEGPVYVVDDSSEQLVSYTAPGTRFRFPGGPWPTPDGRHPWHDNGGWQGHGCLMVQRPDEHVAVWHFWDGPDRKFVCWYLNLQTAFVRSECGYATQDLELDILVFPDGSHLVKDAEVLDDRIVEGRYSPELVEWIRDYGEDLVRRLQSEGPWWDRSWADWVAPAEWRDPARPA